MSRYHFVRSIWILVTTILLSSWPMFTYAADTDANLADKLQSFVSSGKLHQNIKKTIDQTGVAEALLILDNFDANVAALNMKNRLGLRLDNNDVIRERARLHRKKKNDLQAAVSQDGYTVLEDFDQFPVIHIKVDKPTLAKLLDRSDVAYIGENMHFSRKLSESLPLVDAILPHNGGFTGSGTSVAVLDAGVDYTLEEFGSCTAPGVPSGCKVSYAQNFATTTGGLGINSDHGTNVAAIVLGVAPDARILDLNVFRSDGFAYETDVIRALQWVLSNRAAYNIVAVNMSFGVGGYSSTCAGLPLSKVIDDLKGAGITVVAASGNDGFTNALSYPACSPAMVSVGAVYDANVSNNLYWKEANCTDATTTADQVGCFSNSAPFLTMLAPGAEITAAGMAMSGTSQAAPHVVGAVALLKSNNPSLAVDDIVVKLITSGLPVTDARNGITKPRLNVYSAINNPQMGVNADTAKQANGNNTSDATGGIIDETPYDGNKVKGFESGPAGQSQTGIDNNPYHQINGPGWIRRNKSAVSHEAAQAYLNSIANSSAKSGTTRFSAMSATDTSPEITELARTLMKDPKLIYDYVHNNIDYVPYYGALKGATLTYLDGSGNDFDQASLMIALLRASGITAQYVYGKMTIPGDQLAKWLGVNQDWDLIANKVLQWNGIPVTAVYTDATTTFYRVWVKATISGTDYLFDPAFKTYDYTSENLKIDLPSAMGYSQSEFLTGATTGATVGTDYVQNLNEGNIRTKLATYANNLVATIRSNQQANKSVEEIIGGRSIVPSTTTQYSTTLTFPTTDTTVWDDIPNESGRITTMRIQHAGIDCTINTHDLRGKRLTLTYPNNIPTLLLDGEGPSCTKSTGDTTTNGTQYALTMTIKHPYNTQIVPYSPISGSTYSIVYNFGGTADSLIQKRQQQLDTYQSQGLGSTTEAILGETLNIMGQSWLKEVMLSNRLLSTLSNTVSVMHHNIGLMAQETKGQKTYYYIDVKAGFVNPISKRNIDTDADTHYYTFGLIGSAFEHGIMEQLGVIDNSTGKAIPGISTVKVFQIANASGGKIFYANGNNFTLGSNIKSQLINYDLAKLQTLINSGNTLILPANGQQQLGQWSGAGYIAKTSTDIQMLIGVGLNGGTATQPATVSPITVTQNIAPANISTANPTTIRCQTETTFLPSPPSCSDPVDMASGAYFHDHTDLSLGGSAPLGLSFTRSYDSSLYLTKKTLGYGWTHNYDGNVTPISHSDPVLGRRQPVDAASFSAAAYVMLDILKTQNNIQGWMAASLASKWAVDQTIDNAVAVSFGKKVMEFIKLADGAYASPPGETTRLQKNGDGTFSLIERFGARTDFDANKRISKVTDVDGNTLTFNYSGGILSTVEDAFRRTLTLGYVNGRISSVSDSAGRSVSYGYDANGDLTSYTDPESKPWGYSYDGHRMTTMSNPLLITNVTNIYDSLGRVKQQIIPRQTQPDGSTTATYNFYISGYRSSEEDPGGNLTIFYFDTKGRTIGEENALGQKSTKRYDGQNHLITNIDPRTNITSYLYDVNHNLTQVTNAQEDPPTIYSYDTLFRLTDITDPLQHKTHFEYDTKHHLTLTRDNEQNTTSATYNGPKGAKDTATDGRSTVTSFAYDNYGNPQTSKTAAHPAISYVYDPIGRMTDLTDPVGSHTSFVYDKRNLLKTITDPSRTYTTVLDYYDDGSLRTKTDRNGKTITYTYTPSGKLESKSYTNDSPVSYTYNKLDQFTGMQDSMGSTTYGYDPAGRLNSVTDAQGFAVSYLYDAAGNLKELTYPGNKKVIYEYDALNRLHTVMIDWLPSKPVATYNYKPQESDLLDNLVQFNGIKTTYSFDTAHRLKGIDIPSVASYSFTELDGNGNRKNVTFTEPLSVQRNSSHTDYTYNSTKNRLQSAGSSSFGYDNEGQLSSGYGGSYTFDNEHRLTAMNGASFYYDGAGNRLKAIRSGVTTKYVYDAGGNLLAEADANNNITRYYVYGAGLLAMVTPSDQVYNYHFNANGSTIAITDQSQVMVNKYLYDPFGFVGNQQENIAQPFKFVGQYGVMAEPNGLYYMKARYYDQMVGRFISEDPLGFDGGDVNLSAYTSNNPVNYIDPSGLDGVNTVSAITTIAGTIQSVTSPQTTAGQLVTGIAVDSAAHMFNIAPNQTVSDVGGLTTSSVSAGLALASGGTGAVVISGFGLGLSIGNTINHLSMPFTDGLNVQQTITEGLIYGNNPFKSKRKCQ